eukprot:TRINITY_DN254_c1_g1_i2.p1 TRINITY_DN254_c1_g1~~TRINITY_DN254_c1_g1_i2.p1  ORF type:complete len:933 (-),score=238.19 TRINITY_DN254_c1_g1_i2:227-3025(-)
MSKYNETNCDREPIRIPGCIQPHGILICLKEPEMTILQVSQNIGERLGFERVEDLLYQNLGRVVGEDSYNNLCKRISAEGDVAQLNPYSFVIPTMQKTQDTNVLIPTSWDATFHRSGGLLLMEMELSTSRNEDYLEAFYKKGKQSITALAGTHDVQLLTLMTVNEVARITGYDRVMAYRFDKDGHGEVVAEKKDDSLRESFHGLRYPATDIPKQARELYLKNWIRVIPDRSYQPVPIIPPNNPLTDEPLDLSFAWSRSVSPIHLQYLKNMGVEASMSISLVVEGKLWGLIACHNSHPRYVPYEARSMCEFLGQMLSWHIDTSAASMLAEQLHASRHHTTILYNAMSLSETWITGLLAQPDQLLGMVGATGAAVCYDRQIFRVGKTPPLESLVELVEIYKKFPPCKTLSTDCLADHYDRGSEIKDTASGVLATFLSQANGDAILWFRPEVAKTVNWGGRDVKGAADAHGNLAPRASFALWKEVLSGKSETWQNSDEVVASELRHSVMEMVIKHRIKKAHDQEILRVKIAEEDLRKQEEFIDTICHEIRNPINGITGSVELLRDQLTQIRALMSTFQGAATAELSDSIEEIKLNIDSIAECAEHQTMITNDVLKFNVNGPAHELVRVPFVVQTVIQQVARMFVGKIQKRGIKFNLNVPAHPLVVRGDAQRLKQVVINLVANAVKFTEKGQISVSMGKVLATAQHKFIQISVEDTGIGMTEDERQALFSGNSEEIGSPIKSRSATNLSRTLSEVGSSGDLVGDMTRGGGLGLKISRRNVQLMKGDLEISSQKNVGSQFSFTIETDRLSDQEEQAFLKTLETQTPPVSRGVDSPLPVALKSRGKILIVEDNSLNQKILMTILTRNGYQVSVANNGLEGVEASMAEKFDLLFMDIEMPKMDGHEATRQIRKREKELKITPTPIICLVSFQVEFKLNE